MRDLEDKVRGEVEMLWERYQTGVGRDEQLERTTSSERISDLRRTTSSSRQTFPSHLRSVSSPLSPPASASAASQAARDPEAGVVGSLVNSIPVDTPPDDPMLGNESPSDPPPVAASLLSASLKTNSFRMPPRQQTAKAQQNAEMGDTIDALTKQFGKDTEAKSIAMSYAFSAFDENMAQGRAARSASAVGQEPAKSEEQRERDARKDSWIDEERVMSRVVQDVQTQPERAALVPDKLETETEQPKQKRDRVKSVKFEEPLKESSEPTVEELDPDLVESTPLAEDGERSISC